MADVARAAHVGKGTLYRHFPTRADLLASISEQARSAAVATSEDRLRPAGELARATPTPLSVAAVLNKVPPHLLGEQIVAEAMRIGGVASAAVYLVDLEGTRLLRLAGPPSFPERLPVTLAVGTEVPQEGLPALRAVVDDHLPGAVCAPLLLRGRALGTLVAVGSAADGLEDLAYEAAAAISLAGDYTDHLDGARRIRPTSPAAEIQQNLLPPRIVRTNGALIAATSYRATRSAATGSTTPRTRAGRGSASPTPRATARGPRRWRPSPWARSAPRATRGWTCRGPSRSWTPLCARCPSVRR
jgi:AcrR family transcriptional regulator